MTTCIVEDVERLTVLMNMYIDPSFVEVNESRFEDILGAINWRRQDAYCNGERYADVQQRVFAIRNFTHPGVRYLVDPGYCEINFSDVRPKNLTQLHAALSELKRLRNAKG
jgi:hypothetical protein